jgi:imidazolonepropionase-like amidohydrolase
MNRLRIITIAAAVAIPSAATAQTVAIEGATVHTAPGTTLENATVVIRDGTIAAVGKGVKVPAGATRIDGKGKVVTAGFIEASTDLGLSEVGQETSTNDGRFPAAPGPDGVNAAYRVSDGFNTTSVAIPLARTGGVTAVVPTPRGSLIAGTSALVALRSDDRSKMIARDPLAMYTTLGEAAMASAKGSRGMAVKRLREVLDDAREYRRRKGNYERNQTRDFAAGRLDLEALVPVVQGRLPLVVRAHKAADIRAALRVGREMGARIIIEGGTEAWMVGKELAAAGAGVILDPLANLPSSFDRINVVEDIARRLHAAGVTIAISTLGDGANARLLRQRVGNAIARGLPADAGLAAVTTGPAALFGLRDRGTIARGKVADLVVWSGDPFELSTQAERVFVGGVDQSLDTRQKRLFRRHRANPAKQR